MAAVKIQLEELDKLNPRYVLEHHTIRGMIQEADNMDKGLKAVLSRMQTHKIQPDDVPSAPQSRSPCNGYLLRVSFHPSASSPTPTRHSGMSLSHLRKGRRPIATDSRKKSELRWASWILDDRLRNGVH